MFKKLVSTVFAVALFLSSAVSAQTDTQVLAEQLATLPAEELNQVVEDTKAALTAGMTEEEAKAVVAQIDCAVASLGSSTTLSKKDAKIVWVVVGVAGVGALFLSYKYLLPRLKTLISKKEETKGGPTDAKTDAKAATTEDKAGAQEVKAAATADKDAHKGHSHAKDDNGDVEAVDTEKEEAQVAVKPSNAKAKGSKKAAPKRAPSRRGARA